MTKFEKALLIIFCTILALVLATVIISLVVAHSHNITFVEQWTEWLKAMHFIK